MDSEILSVIKDIKNKTGIDIDVFTPTMKSAVSTREKPEIVAPSENSFREIYSDKVNKKTYFRFKNKSTSLIGSINGDEETEYNYAVFIASYLESLNSRDNSVSKNEYLKNIVLGDCSRIQIQKYMRKYLIGDIACYVLLVSTIAEKTEEIINFMETYTNNQLDSAVVVDDTSCVLVKFLDNNAENEYQSAASFAQMLADSLMDELNIAVNIGVGGTVKNLLDVNVSYQQAAAVLRMNSVFESKGNVHTYKEYILVKILEDIPKFKLSEYLDVLLDPEAREVFTDEDMMMTADEFLGNNLNVSETSRSLFMHRNTLMYRMEKIEKATGLNLKNFSDAVTFKLMTILFKLIGN